MYRSDCFFWWSFSVGLQFLEIETESCVKYLWWLGALLSIDVIWSKYIKLLVHITVQTNTYSLSLSLSYHFFFTSMDQTWKCIVMEWLFEQEYKERRNDSVGQCIESTELCSHEPKVFLYFIFFRYWVNHSHPSCYIGIRWILVKQIGLYLEGSFFNFIKS